MAKLGIGATSPDAAHKTLKATAAGTSAWGYSGLVKLGEVSGTGASGVLEIASIPATFRNLVVSWVGRSSAAATSDLAVITFETSPTAGAYNHQRLRGQGATAAADENIGATHSIQASATPAASSAANLFAAGRIYLPEYANTSIFKTVGVQGFGAADISTGLFQTTVYTGVWESTAAIDRVRLTLAAGNWVANSRMTLYGEPV